MSPRNSSLPAVRAARERREQKLADLHAQLTAGIERLTSSDEWVAWLRVASRFHSYSFNNTMLIHAQRPDATQVAGYQVWHQLGRQVNKGEHGIRILAPVVRRQSGGSEESGRGADVVSRATTDRHVSDDAPDPRRVAGFRVATVFDVSQTSGDPLPEPERPRLVAGRAPAGMWDQLAGQVETRGFALDRGPCGGERNGYTDFLDHIVVVRDDVDDAQAVKTLAHELGHVMLHGPDEMAARDTRVCRGTAEVEAESVAFLVSAARGLDASGYTFPYIARWAASVGDGKRGVADVIQRAAARVLSTAHEVLGDIEPPGQQAASTAVPHGVRELGQAGKARTAAVRRAEGLARQGAALRPGPSDAGTTSDVDRIMAANAAAAAWWGDQLRRPARAGPRQYLLDRGVGHVLAPSSPWHIGYAEDRWVGLLDQLRTEGFSDPDLLDAGLVTRSRRGNLIDRFRDRIMLPIRRPDAGIVGFIGRAAPGASSDVPKYLNTTSTAAFSKGDVLFGLAEQSEIMRRGRTLLVEGPFDVLAVAGVRPDTAAVAPSGTALTDRQAALLAQYAPQVVVALDGDTAGMNATVHAYERLRSAYLDPEWLRLPSGVDPADLANAADPRLAIVLDQPTRPLADALVDHALAAHDLRNAQQLVVANRHAAHVIAGLPASQVARQVTRVADHLDLDVAAVTQALTEASTRRQELGHRRGRHRQPDEAPASRSAAAERAFARLPRLATKERRCSASVTAVQTASSPPGLAPVTSSPARRRCADSDPA